MLNIETLMNLQEIVYQLEDSGYYKKIDKEEKRRLLSALDKEIEDHEKPTQARN